MKSVESGDYWLVSERGVIYLQGYYQSKQYKFSTRRRKSDGDFFKHVRQNAYALFIAKVHEKLAERVDQEEVSLYSCFDDFVREFFRTKFKEGAHKKATFSMYERFIFPVFGKRGFDQITVLAVETWFHGLDEYSISSDQKRRVYDLLKRLCVAAFRYKFLPENVFEFVDIKRPKSISRASYRPYSESQVQTLLQASRGWFRVFLLTSFATGRRTGVVMGLRVEDLDLDKGTWNIRRRIYKGSVLDDENHKFTKEEIPLFPFLVDVLREFVGDRSQGWVFENRNGTYYADSVTILNSYLVPLLNECGLPHRCLYASRHTFVSMLVNSGVDVSFVAGLVGHKNVRTTLNSYTKETEERAGMIQNVNNLLYGKLFGSAAVVSS